MMVCWLLASAIWCLVRHTYLGWVLCVVLYVCWWLVRWGHARSLSEPGS